MQTMDDEPRRRIGGIWIAVAMMAVAALGALILMVVLYSR